MVGFVCIGIAMVVESRSMVWCVGGFTHIDDAYSHVSRQWRFFASSVVVRMFNCCVVVSCLYFERRVRISWDV